MEYAECISPDLLFYLLETRQCLCDYDLLYCCSSLLPSCIPFSLCSIP